MDFVWHWLPGETNGSFLPQIVPLALVLHGSLIYLMDPSLAKPTGLKVGEDVPLSLMDPSQGILQNEQGWFERNIAISFKQGRKRDTGTTDMMKKKHC